MYGFPLRATMHVEIWSDLLEQAGLPKSAIFPRTGRGYWCSGDDLSSWPIARRQAAVPGGVGRPMGVKSTDSLQSFYTFDGYCNVKLVDDDVLPSG